MINLSLYSGRWVAISNAEVVAVGSTAERTYSAALAVDPDEAFYLSFIEDPLQEGLHFAGLLEKLRPLLQNQGVPVYLVGGAVRDALLNRLSHDLDFVVPRDAVSLSFRLGDVIGAPAYALDAQRDTGRIVLPATEETLDFAHYRGPDLFADLRDRDFTINSLALPATARTRQSVIDPTNGLADLDSGLLRLARADALRRDPVRALRAVRLAAELRFTITPETKTAISEAADGLLDVSAERIRDELVKIARGPRVDTAFEQMNQLGLLAVILPEVAALEPVSQSPPHHENGLQHTISVLRWLERLELALFGQDPPEDITLEPTRLALSAHLAVLETHYTRPIDGGLDGRVILRLAALFHDVGKRSTMRVDENGRYRFFGHAEAGAELITPRLRQLCLSNEACAQIKRIVATHMRPLLLAQSLGSNPSRRATYRFFKATGKNGLDVGLLALADHLATYDGPGDASSWNDLLDLVATLFDSYFERYDEAVKPPVLVNGRDLMDHLGLPQGPEVGRILNLIEEYQAAGEITTREEALLFAERMEW